MPANSSFHPMIKATVNQSNNFKTTSLPIKSTLKHQIIHSLFVRLSNFLHKTRPVFWQLRKKTKKPWLWLPDWNWFSVIRRESLHFLQQGETFCIQLFRETPLKIIPSRSLNTTYFRKFKQVQCGTTMSQSELTAHTTKERESAHVQVSVIFGLASHWSKSGVIFHASQ